MLGSGPVQCEAHMYFTQLHCYALQLVTSFILRLSYLFFIKEPGTRLIRQIYGASLYRFTRHFEGSEILVYTWIEFGHSYGGATGDKEEAHACKETFKKNHDSLDRERDQRMGKIGASSG